MSEASTQIVTQNLEFENTTRSKSKGITKEQKKIKGVIFDFDGVLVSIETRFGRPALQALKSVQSSISREQIVEGMLKVFDFMTQEQHTGGLNFIKLFFRIGKNIGLTRGQAAKFVLLFWIYYKKNKEKIVLICGVQDTIKELVKKKYKIVLITNSGNKTIAKAIAKFPELRFFDLIISRDDVLKSKPHPEGFLRALNELDLLPEEIISIGDQASDIIVGKKVGTKTIAISYEYINHLKEHFLDYKPDYIIQDIRDLSLVLTIEESQLLPENEITFDLTATSHFNNNLTIPKLSHLLISSKKRNYETFVG